ncbi:hypothetical protein F4801DRAFT_590468 [Xylaria longipes]|nr:hypothetical protein F4801DRAFT_590468 [Xylaria longipes]
MTQYLPLHRTSFASLEDDRFFSACSSQPGSRLMSVFTSQEQDQLAENTNSTARPSEPLASVCLPLAESMLPPPREQSPVLEPSANSHDHLPKHHRFNPTSNRRQSGAKEPPAETDTTYQGRLPLITKAQLDYHVSKQEIDNILRNIRGYLSARQHRDSCGKPAMPVAPENKMPPSPFLTPLESPYLEAQTLALPDDQYLVTKGDIVGILDIVVTGIRKFQDDSIQPDCQSLVSPNSTHVKPTLHAQNIIPCASAIADPATTICLPRTCFSLADSPEAVRHLSPTAITTYGMIKIKINGFDSFSEISCQDNINDDGYNGDIPEVGSPGPSICFSRYNLENRHLSWPQSPRVPRRVSFGINPSCDLFYLFEKKSRKPGQRSTSEPNPQWRPGLIRAATTPITSFPRLISRSCTNDWLTPLGLCGEMESREQVQDQETITNLYNHGVDAHSGVCIHSPLPILEEVPRTTSTCPDCSPFLDDYHSPIRENEGQWLSLAEDNNGDHRKRLGRSIGVARHRRIKAREPRDQHQNFKENLLDGLRRYSFLPLLDQTPENIRGEHPTNHSWMEIPLEGDRGRKLSSQELLQQILHQSDTSSMRSSRSKSSSGAMTTTQLKGGGRGQSQIEVRPCSEDTTPHICLDEQWRNENFR